MMITAEERERYDIVRHRELSDECGSPIVMALNLTPILAPSVPNATAGETREGGDG
jgi:hypothetical protein